MNLGQANMNCSSNCFRSLILQSHHPFLKGMGMGRITVDHIVHYYPILPMKIYHGVTTFTKLLLLEAF